MTVTDMSIAADPAQDIGHEIAALEAFGIPAIGRLVVGRAVDVVEDRPRQPPLGERPEVMEVVAVLQAHVQIPHPACRDTGSAPDPQVRSASQSPQRLVGLKYSPPKACVARKPWHFGSMTDAKDDLALAAEFPAATREQWLALVDKALKGAPFEKKLVSKTYDGLRIEPLYPRRTDATPLAGRAPRLHPGRSWRGSIIPIRPIANRLAARRSRRRRHRRWCWSAPGAIGAYGLRRRPFGGRARAHSRRRLPRRHRDRVRPHAARPRTRRRISPRS